MGIFEEGRATLELTLAARMGLAALLGSLLGLERESRGKSAGEQTFAIAALGAAGFSGVAASLFPPTAGEAVAGVATGILATGLALLILEFDRMPGLRACTGASPGGPTRTTRDASTPRAGGRGRTPRRASPA